MDELQTPSASLRCRSRSTPRPPHYVYTLCHPNPKTSFPWPTSRQIINVKTTSPPPPANQVQATRTAHARPDRCHPVLVIAVAVAVAADHPHRVHRGAVGAHLGHAVRELAGVEAQADDGVGPAAAALGGQAVEGFVSGAAHLNLGGKEVTVVSQCIAEKGERADVVKEPQRLRLPGSSGSPQRRGGNPSTGCSCRRWCPLPLRCGVQGCRSRSRS